MNKVILALTVIGIVVLVAVGVNTSSNLPSLDTSNIPSLGYGQIGSECHSTTTTSTWTKRVLSNPNGDTYKTLCSVVVTNTTVGGAFEIRDATSTTDVSSTTKMTFNASATAGAYELNMIFTRGIAINPTVGNVASTTFLIR